MIYVDVVRILKWGGILVDIWRMIWVGIRGKS